ncbi:MAG TPA: hypothetical protein VMN38_07740 [Sphingomicrobium sp.]|nr:hypothetical protein [Sphingomicrobium sp.]
MSAFDPLRTLSAFDMLPIMAIHHLRTLTTLTLVGGLCLSSPANGCEYTDRLFQLPEETEAEARTRSEAIFREGFVIRHWARESFDIKNASTVYIGRVVANDRGQGTGSRPSSTVEPIEAIVGSLPSGRRKLAEALGHSCSNYGDGYGDGEGSAAKVGSLVVVFEGLPKSQERPNGIDSLRATSIRNDDLLERLQRHGNDLDVE